jgi:hypothetical protein
LEESSMVLTSLRDQRSSLSSALRDSFLLPDLMSRVPRRMKRSETFDVRKSNTQAFHIV